MNFDISRSFFKDGSQIRTKWSFMIDLLVGPTWTQSKCVGGDETRQGRKLSWPIPNF
jgi:hypothetical protein